ncbi:classical arabinogalactan protein 9-like [Cryptomeria japonica]|uniref:classical arabinogalactan protein 9-like n=1 Tax=Cryptomeria japonica TaxID=3369 RepID=UPI0025ABD98C|nr:classical arabinogalactan protein 9-like [Cryptomeria japonica]
MTENPPRVSTIAISATTTPVITSTLPVDTTVGTINVLPTSMPLPPPISVSTILVMTTPMMPIATTVLVQGGPLAASVSSSPPPTSLLVVTQVEVTTPTTQSVLPPWLDIVAPKRKKQVVSPDDFDFEQLAPLKAKVTKKPKTVSRVLVDLRRCPRSKPSEPQPSVQPQNPLGFDKGKAPSSEVVAGADGFVPVKDRNRNMGQKRTLKERLEEDTFNRFEALDDLIQQEVNSGLMSLE